MQIDLYKNSNNHDNLANSLDEVILYPKMYFCDLNEGSYETISREEFIDIINNYKTNERLLSFLKLKKDYLYNLIDKYPELSIGTSIISYLDIEYGFHTSKYGIHEPNIIRGYTLINGKWFIRTTSGYGGFHNSFPLELYI